MNNQAATKQMEELPDWSFKAIIEEGERDYAYKVVDKNFASISTSGKYKLDYSIDAIVEALPGTIGLRLFKTKNDAEAKACGIAEAKILRVAPYEDDAFYLPYLRCLLSESEDLDRFYATFQQPKDSLYSFYLALYNNNSLAEYMTEKTEKKIVYCKKIIVLTEIS